MKIILRADVANVGKKGDVVEVSEGYARNYLVAKGLGLKATDGAVAQAAAMRRSRDLKDARDREAAEQLAQALVPVVIRIPAKAGSEGRLFGSVTASRRRRARSRPRPGASLDRRRLHLDDPIKALGVHEVPSASTPRSSSGSRSRSSPSSGSGAPTARRRAAFGSAVPAPSARFRPFGAAPDGQSGDCLPTDVRRRMLDYVRGCAQRAPVRPPRLRSSTAKSRALPCSLPPGRSGAW